MMGASHRKPVHLERIGGKSPRQRIWESIREFAGTGEGDFDLARIERAVRIDVTTIFSYLRSLALAGVIAPTEATQADPQRRQCFTLQRDNGSEAPRLDKWGKPVTQGLGNEQMWRTLRLLGDFTPDELAALASTEQVVIAPESAKNYIGHLARAGYLIVVQPARFLGPRKGNLPARYRLHPAHNTGPRPPMIQRSKAVYDPNLDQVVWQEVQCDDEF